MNKSNEIIEIAELTELFEKINWLILCQLNLFSSNGLMQMFNLEIQEELTKLSANINFNKKYIIFKSIETINLKEKINHNLRFGNLDANAKLFKIYNDKKKLPLKIIQIKKSGFAGGLVYGLVSNIVLMLDKICKNIFDVKKTFEPDTYIYNECEKMYLFYGELYDKFFGLNYFMDEIEKQM